MSMSICRSGIAVSEQTNKSNNYKWSLGIKLKVVVGAFVRTFKVGLIGAETPAPPVA